MNNIRRINYHRLFVQWLCKLISLHGHCLIFILPLLSFAAQAQDKYLFQFVKRNDMFYIPWQGNGAMLDSLLTVVDRNSPDIKGGRMYIHVSSYTTTGANTNQVGYLRCLRVKSELITRAGLSESNFVTEKVIMEPYYGQRDVVVVETLTIQRLHPIAEPEQPIADTQPLTPQHESEVEAAPQASVDTPTLTTTVAAHPNEHALYFRANLLRWATLTSDLGVEWRINSKVGILVDGSWTSWSWDNKNRRYALWRVSPALHYYIGKEKRGYIGAMYHTGEFNYKLTPLGKQGDYQGGGLTGGYQLKLNRALSIDFNLGVGYTRAHYDRYTVMDNVRVYIGKETKNYWGIHQLGTTLVWKIIK